MAAKPTGEIHQSAGSVSTEEKAHDEKVKVGIKREKPEPIEGFQSAPGRNRNKKLNGKFFK